MKRGPDRQTMAAAQRNRLLASASRRQLNGILAEASLVQLEQRRVLYRDNGRISAVYFPVDGVISILVGAGGGAAVEVATVGNEGVTGAGALLGVARPLGRAVVQVAGRAIAVRASDVNRLLCDQPETSVLIRRYLYAFLCQVAQTAACNRYHTAEERCARWLLMTRDRAGADRFSMTQEFLAAMMGARRPTVNLAVSVLRNAGAIEYSYRTLNVIDRGLLESFSCPCYEILRKVFENIRGKSPEANNSLA